MGSRTPFAERDAKEKTKEFEEVKEAILEDIDIAHSKLGQAKMKVMANLKGVQNPSGVLTKQG